MAWKRRRAEGILAREVDGEVLLLDTSLNRIHQLNATAHFIWSHCEQTSSPQELAALLAAAFDVDHSIALRDATRTIDQLQALGLIEDA